MSQWLEGDRRPLSCPVDRNNLTREKDMFPDKATNRKILSFIIKCPSEGCQWTGELKAKEDHLEVCPLKVVSCTNQNCHVTLTRNKLQSHVTTTCDWRILRCEHCSFPSPACKTEAHQSECKRFPLNCSKSCGAVIAREEISAHIANDCPLAIVSCPYAEMGCAAKVQRKEIESHLQSALRIHFELACVKLNDTQVQLNKTQEQLHDTQVQFHSTQNKFEETTRKLEEKINSLQNILMQRPEEYTWKISGFNEVLRQARSGEKTELYSTPFYYNNYKFRLQLNPNGMSSGRDSHLSMYFVIMKGEKDALLPWPFHKKVTFILIDQQEHPLDRENLIMSFTEVPTNKECFERPVTFKNLGMGFPRFVPHTKLNERRYLVDDTICIQVKVELPQ